LEQWTTPTIHLYIDQLIKSWCMQPFLVKITIATWYNKKIIIFMQIMNKTNINMCQLEWLMMVTYGQTNWLLIS
jgi:hypothetical protein